MDKTSNKQKQYNAIYGHDDFDKVRQYLMFFYSFLHYIDVPINTVRIQKLHTIAYPLIQILDSMLQRLHLWQQVFQWLESLRDAPADMNQSFLAGFQLTQHLINDCLTAVLNKSAGPAGHSLEIILHLLFLSSQGLQWYVIKYGLDNLN